MTGKEDFMSCFHAEEKSVAEEIQSVSPDHKTMQSSFGYWWGFTDVK